MSDNKFILQLKGTQTPKSVVEIKNDKLVAPFTNVPGSSDVVGSIIQDKDSSVVVAKGAENWQLDGGALVPATNLTGNGADFTGEYAVSGSGLWVNATYTFPSTGDPIHPVAEIFNPQTKWVLQLCGKNLHTGNGNTIDFSFIVKIGSSHIMTKAVTVSEQANFFCKRFVLDFSESEQSIIKASGGAKLTVQLLCADDSASATIYNGMTILTALQRRIDASEVSASFANVEEVLRDGLLPNDYFSNADIINQIPQNGLAFPVFRRDGDYMLFVGWGDTGLSLEGGVYNVDEIVLSHRIYVDLPVFQSALRNRALLSSNYDVHQYLVPYSGTHCSMFISKQNTIQKNIWTPLYSDKNTSIVVAYIKTNNVFAPLNPDVAGLSTIDDSVLVYFPLLGQTESDAVNVCLVRHRIY